MIQTFLVVVVIFLLIVISWLLWKSGFMMQAEKPERLIDKPVMDAKERKAVMKRFKRWRAEGKLSREELEHLTELCRAEWDEPEN